MRLLGIDLAVDARNTAITRARWVPGSLVVESVSMAGSDDVLESLLDGLSADSAEPTDPEEPVLLCIDAPLGWPLELGSRLSTHRAGEGIGIAANDLFRRETDRDVRRRCGKTPLDVGADRIARTALRAVQFLQTLRVQTDLTIDLPLTLEGINAPGVHALETYPAGYLAARGINARGYRDPAARELRLRLLDDILRAFKALPSSPKSLELRPQPAEFAPRADLLDALLCVLAGHRAATGGAPEPTDTGRAAIEGWIWCG